MLERNALAVGLVLLSFSQLTTIAADFRHELKGYDPQLVVISVGGHNRGANTADEIAVANRKLVSMVRAVVPAAEVRVLGETR